MFFSRVNEFVLHGFFIHIFPTKFSEKENQGANRLFICSTKVECPGGGKFSKKLIFWWNFRYFSKFSFFFVNNEEEFKRSPIIAGGRLYESSRRKPGWRLTAGFELQLPASWSSEKFRPIYNFGCFFLELMNSFFTVLLIRIFAIKFSEKENQGANRLFICSTKVKCPGPGKFSKKMIFRWNFRKFSKFLIFL